MKKITRRFFVIILGLVILIWPGLCDVDAQSLSLDHVTVVRDLSFVQIEFTIQDLPADYNQDVDGLVVVVQKFIIDVEDGKLKPFNYDTIWLKDVDFSTMIEDVIVLNWMDSLSNHDIGPDRYALFLANLEDINQAYPITSGHETIFLHDMSDDETDMCHGSVIMRWDNYKYFSTSGSGEDEAVPFFTHNRIMYLPPGGDTDSVAETLPFDSLTYDFVFNHGPGDYLIWVQAVELSSEGDILRYSNSNFRTEDFESPVLTNLEITKVDVVNNRDIEVVFEAEGGQTDDLDEFTFDVYRADAPDGDYILLNGSYTLIDMGIPFSLLGTYAFTDNNVPDIQAGPYYYRVVAHLLECEVEFRVSSVVSSLFLGGDIETYTETILYVVLNGAHYPGGMGYQLYRNLPWDTIWQPVGFPGNSLSFDDNLSMYIDSLAGEISYMLMAISHTDTVYSNEVTLYINVGLEMYNAFKPDSDRPDNRTFRPRLKGVTPTLFRLVIYNNWGQDIYSFTNQSGSLDDWDVWDGRASDGSEVPAGVYGYRIEYQIRNEERVEKRGLVTLLR